MQHCQAGHTDSPATFSFLGWRSAGRDLFFCSGLSSVAALAIWAVRCCLAMAVFPREDRACDMTCCILVICLVVVNANI